jgi:hypothetical protein
MPGDIGHLGGQELVHPSHVVDPHDLQRRLEQAGQSGKADGDTRHQHDRMVVGAQRPPGHVGMQEAVVE